MEALKPGMSVKVEKGCAARGVKKGMTLKVESVTELGPDYSHMVKVVLSVQGRTLAFYARHPNRLSDATVSMNTGRPEDRIIVRQVDSTKLSEERDTKMNLVWEKSGTDVWVSKPLKVNLNPGATSRTFTVVFRIDGRDRTSMSMRGGPSGYRVDRGGIMGWEAIDGGKGPTTPKAARELASKYLAEIVKQGTLTPS